MHELHAFVSGRVQMVMYRDFATRKAQRLGLVGFVRNLDDGRVEVVAQGTDDALDRYVAYLRKGSVLARVADVEAERRSPTRSFDAFTLVR